jgi:hypothetical protein
MRFPIKHVGYSCALGAFLFSGVAFAAQGTADMKEKPPEQCMMGGRLLPNVKTGLECINKGGAWVRMEPTTIQPHLPEKDKAMPPIDPLGKGKEMPPARPIGPSDGR